RGGNAVSLASSSLTVARRGTKPSQGFRLLQIVGDKRAKWSPYIPHGGFVDKGRTIFIVDDDQGLQDFVFTFLSARGYQVECFGSGEALLSRLRGDSCARLILLDVVMPGCDGVEVIQRIRGIGSNIPVIMLSGLTDIRTVVESMKLGALDFLMKPFDEYALENLIKGMFEQEATAQSVSKRTAA